VTILAPGLDLTSLRQRFAVGSESSPLHALRGGSEALSGAYHGACRLEGDVTLAAAELSQPAVVAGPAGEPLLEVHGSRKRVTLRGLVFRDARCARGALAVLGSVNRVTIQDCVFFDDEHDDPRPGAGAISIQSGFLKLERCLFWGNTGQTGGAIALREGSRLVAENCLFVANRGVEGGGALWIEGTSSAKLTGCTFVANLSEDELAGQSIHAGGTIYDKGSAKLINCVLLDHGNTFGHPEVTGGEIEATASLLPPQAQDYPPLRADESCAFRVADFPEPGFPFALPTDQQLSPAALESEPKPGSFFGAPVAWSAGGVGAVAAGGAS